MSINPLPSLIQASSHDAAATRAREAGRKAWNRADYNEAARTSERLIRQCYSRRTDKDKNLAKLRFSIACQMQREGQFDLDSNFDQVMQTIDQVIAA